MTHLVGEGKGGGVKKSLLLVPLGEKDLLAKVCFLPLRKGKLIISSETVVGELSNRPDPRFATIVLSELLSTWADPRTFLLAHFDQDRQ